MIKNLQIALAKQARALPPPPPPQHTTLTNERLKEN